jgi:hypothetical protein
MNTVRRTRDSSITRVAPLLNLGRSRGDWVKELLSSADCGHSLPTSALATIRDPEPARCYWSPREKALHPPVTLLQWLILNMTAPKKGWGSSSAAERRRALVAKDPTEIQAALAELNRKPRGRGWHILEGASYPDAYAENDEYVLVIEGKRTERGPTVRTTWMEGRHQMWRHLDAAWEVRGTRRVIGVTVVEGSYDGSIPAQYREYARNLQTAEALQQSLPHRDLNEREQIRECFAGVTTWQRLAARFGANPRELPETVADVETWLNEHGVAAHGIESGSA